MLAEITITAKPQLAFIVRPAVGDRIEVIAGTYKGETGKVTELCGYGYTLFLDNGMTHWYFQPAQLRRLAG